MPAEHDLGRAEAPTVRTRSVLLVTATMLAALVIIAFGFELFFTDRVGTTIVYRQSFPGPGVVPDERTEREALEKKQRDLLAGGNGRPPIEKAMQAIVARGPHAFDAIEPTR